MRRNSDVFSREPRVTGQPSCTVTNELYSVYSGCLHRGMRDTTITPSTFSTYGRSTVHHLLHRESLSETKHFPILHACPQARKDKLNQVLKIFYVTSKR